VTTNQPITFGVHTSYITKGIVLGIVRKNGMLPEFVLGVLRILGIVLGNFRIYGMLPVLGVALGLLCIYGILPENFRQVGR
jgi:hypothetical protein